MHHISAMTDEGDGIDLRSILPQRTTSRPDGWEYALAKGGKTWWGYYDTSGLRPSSSRASTLAEQLYVSVVSHLQWATASAPGWARALELRCRHEQGA